jgi:hypothetical protein
MTTRSSLQPSQGTKEETKDRMHHFGLPEDEGRDEDGVDFELLEPEGRELEPELDDLTGVAAALTVK